MEEEYSLRYGEMPCLKDVVPEHQTLLSITKATPIQEIAETMEEYNFSQLPVIENHEIQGYVSWRTIGEKIARGEPITAAESCMQRIQDNLLWPASTHLEKVIGKIAKYDFVLVTESEDASSNSDICGIVTISDIAEQYSTVILPYIFIARIELDMRDIVYKLRQITSLKCIPKFDREILDEKNLGSLNELFLKLVEHEELLEEEVFRDIKSQLETLRKFRNDIMHFHKRSEPAQELDLQALSENIARLKTM